MSEKRFIWKCDDETCHIFDTVTKARYFYEGIMNLLNEQQATINRMKHSLNTIYKSFEKKFGYDMRNAIWLIDEISYEEWKINCILQKQMQ